jgi:hypothetical protein
MCSGFSKTGTQTLTFSAGPVCVSARERARIALTASP